MQQEPPAQHIIDLAIISQVISGDKHAYALIVDKYQHRVMTLVRRYINDPIEAIDVVQEVFLRVYKALPKFRGDSHFYTWLYRIAINTAKNYAITNMNKKIDSMLDFTEYELLLDLKHFNQLYQPDHETYLEEVEQFMQQALDELPVDLKMTLKLREIDGLTYEEISNVMECPIGTVRSRIFRARENLQKRVHLNLKTRGYL